MPPRPPSWSQGRQYGIVIDAGSSGSRVQVYSWLDPEIAKQMRKANKKSIDVLSKVEKGVESGDGWHLKREPGISTFGANPEGVADYLKPLIDFAASVIPAAQRPSTPIYLLATAGMRLLPPEQQSAVLSSTCNFLRTYPFSLPDCDENVRIISGEEEGLYGWIAVNYLMDGFDKHEHSAKGEELHSSTYGFLDMGGASTQIAFEPSAHEQIAHADNLLEVKLRLLSGKDVRHPVFVTTWLGFGTNQARQRYIDSEIKAHVRESDAAHVPGSNGGAVMVDDPCLPKSLLLSAPRHSGYTLRGTGDFANCVRRTGPLLNKEVECLDQPCLFNGVHVPPIDFSVNHFIGISEYWYSTQDIWSMGGVYDFVEFEKNAMEFCGRHWDDIMADHKSGGRWKSTVELSRLEAQCFKAAWIVNVLHEGIGIPRIIDKGGHGDGTNVAEKGTEKAIDKGLVTPPPSFQSMNEVGDVAVSWTLGKMVLEVSKGTTAIGTAESFKPTSPSVVDWKGHIPAWSGDMKSTIAAVKNADTLPLVALPLFAFILYFFFVGKNASRRRQSLCGGLMASKRRSDFTLLAQEEGGFSGNESTTSTNGDRPPRLGRRKSQSFITRVVAPVRYGAWVLSSTLRSWSTNPRSGSSGGSLLPTTRTTAAYSFDEPLRPRPLRGSKSTPFLRASSTPTPSANASSSSGSVATTYYNDIPDVTERSGGAPGVVSSLINSGNTLPRSHSTSILSHVARSASPPPIAIVSASPLSRPPSRGSAGTPLGLTKLTPRTRESSEPQERETPRRSVSAAGVLDTASTVGGRGSSDGMSTPPMNDRGLSNAVWDILGGANEELEAGSTSSPTSGVGNGVNGTRLRASKSQNGSQVNLSQLGGGLMMSSRRKEGGSSSSLAGTGGEE